MENNWRKTTNIYVNKYLDCVFSRVGKFEM